MFNVPGAKKYDFSHFNPLIVAAVILLICYLGSKNTYYDQFYKVSQLPENRTELSILQSFKSEIANNKVIFNMSLRFAFKITFQNFRQSFTVKIDHYGFKSIYHYNNLFDYQLDSNNYLSGFALSSVFGNVNISFLYLDELIHEMQTNIPGISLLFPGNTLISKKDDHYHFSNVYINEKNELKVYFQYPIEYDLNWVAFESGRILPMFSIGKIPKEECTNPQPNQCNVYDPITHLFALPSKADLNPYTLFLSVFNAIADFSKPNQDKIVVLLDSPMNEEASQILHEMKPFFNDQFEILDSEKKNFFKELRIRFKTSQKFNKLTQKILKDSKYSEQFIENNLLIITDSETQNLFPTEKVNEIASQICKSVEGGCKPDVIEFKNDINVVSKINQAHYLIMPKKKAYFMFPLCQNAKVFLFSKDEDNSDDSWINKMEKDLSVDVNFVKYTNDGLDSSVFNF